MALATEPPNAARRFQNLASLMPNIILESNFGTLFNKKGNNILVVLLRIDISGFTKLSEICAERGGSDGIFQLTNILNNYFGGISTIIYDNGGDIWKFAGDSLLAIWRIEMKDVVQYVRYRAVRCALMIQKQLGYFDTGVKVVLRLKIGLSYGNVMWAMIGNDFSRRHIVVGEPVTEVMEADHFASSGDVIAAASIWNCMSSIDFIYDIIVEDRFVKIISLVSYLGISSPKSLRAVGAPGFEERIGKRRLTTQRPTQGRVLPEIAENKSMGSYLRICLLDPVVQQIDADLSLDFLTEMRILTVMFVHIVPCEMLNIELIALVDKAYNILYGLVRSTGGYVDKACLFDKDIMFVCFFGLRGLYQTDEVARYLACAHCVREACRSIHGIIEVSLGLTTSNIFCGVIGNAMYQNYTVIGPAANLAARLMCTYPGQVTCDETTRETSNLDPSWFLTCPKRKIRNISEDVVAYEYVGSKSRRLQTILRSGTPPLLGRSWEFNEYSSILKNPKGLSGGIMIEGEKYSGKSRIVYELMLIGCQKGKIGTVVGLFEPHSRFPFFAAIHILTQALNLGSGKQRENALRKLIENDLDEEDLLQISVLCSKWPYLSNPAVNDSMKRVFVTALKNGFKLEILLIDDVHLCDSASWELVMAAVEAKVVFMIITLENIDAVPKSIQEHVKIWKLQPLNSELLAAVACQALNACAIQSRVLTFLLNSTQGNPGKCEVTLKALIRQKFIDIVNLDEVRSESLRLVSVPEKLLESKVYDYTLQQTPSAWTAPGDPVCLEKKQNLSYCGLLARQRTWAERDSEYGIMNTGASHEYIPNDTFKIMAADNFHLDIDEIKKPDRGHAKEYIDLFTDFLGTRKVLKVDPMRPIPCIVFEKSIDELEIEEAVSNFIMAKERARKTLAPKGDLNLDTLRKHRSITGEDVTVDDVNTSSDEEDDGGKGSHLSSSKAWKSIQSMWSTISDSSAKMFLESRGSENRFPTIVVKPGVNLEEDAVKPDSYHDLLFIFDSLRPFEQLLLKCCSVIGYEFSRSMVDELLHHPDPTFTSLAVKRLFELKILSCSLLGRLDKDTLCACRNGKLSSQKDEKLPSYAFCQNQAFRYNKFRDAIYGLLPPNLKRLFHERAVEFLQNKSTLCSLCQSIDTRISEGRPSGAGDANERTDEISLLLSIISSFRMPDWAACKCNYTKEIILDQMILHAFSAELLGKQIEFMVSKAEHLITMEHYGAAYDLVKSTQGKCKTAVLGKNKNFMLARIEICYAEIDLAENLLRSAIRNINSAISRVRWLWGTKGFGEIFTASFSNIFLLKGEKVATLPILVRALILLARIRMIKEDYRDVETLCIAVSRLLLHGSIADEDTAKCYTLFMDACMKRRKLSYDKEFEATMVHVTIGILSQPSVASVSAALQIIYVIANSRAVCAGDAVDSLELLLEVDRLGNNIPFKEGFCEAGMDIVCIHIARLQLKEAAKRLASLKGDIDEIHFHAACLNYFRMTGFWVESPRDSLLVLKRSLSGAFEDTRSNREGVIAMWLWYLYTKPALAAEWEEKISFRSYPVQPITTSSLFLFGHETWATILQLHYSSFRSPFKVRLLSKKIAALKSISKNLHYLVPWYYFLEAHVLMWLHNNPSAALSHLELADKSARECNCLFISIRISLIRECWLRGVQPQPFDARYGGEWTQMEVTQSSIFKRKRLS